MDRRSFLATGVGALCLVCGCKPKAPYEIVPLSGKVTYQGKPLPNTFHIEFEAGDGSRPSMGKILDDAGSFETWHTGTQKGVKPGPNTVTVYWDADPNVTPVPEEYVDMIAKYGFTGTDKLKVEIKGKDSKFEVKFE